MKHLLMALLVGAFSFGIQLEATKSSPCDGARKEQLCCNPKILKQSDVGVGGFIAISNPGAYALGQDIAGWISIDADNVCLDLKGHIITVQDNTYAIFLDDPQTNIIVKNGTIFNNNLSGKGVFMAGCNSIVLEDLDFKGVSEAIFLEDCTNGCLKNIDASNNTIFGTSMIDIQGTSLGLSHTFDICRLVVSHCTISNASQPLVNIETTDNVTMKGCRINNNKSTDGSTTFRPLNIMYGNNIVFAGSEVNDNSVTAAGAGIINAFFGNNDFPQDRVYYRNYCISKSEFNNSIVEESSFAYGLSAEGITGLFIDCCEANGTTIRKAVGGNIGAIGMQISSVDGLHMHNSEANKTTHESNIVGQDPHNLFSGPKGISLLFVANGHVESCQAIGTRIVEVTQGSGLNVAIGILIFFTNDTTLCKTEASRSFSEGEQAYGFVILFAEGVTFTHCKGNNNEAQDVASGFYIGGVQEILIEESCALGNKAKAEAGVGYGFAFEFAFDLRIQESFAKHNSTAGFFFGDVDGDESSENENIQILRNCAEENGNGFVVDTTREDDFASNLIFFENKAIDNTFCGFKEVGDNFDTPTTWIGNKAKGNGTDFCVNPPIDIEFKKHGKLSCKEKCDDKEQRDLANISFCDHSHRLD